jgi:hypothetical protein
MEDPWIVESDPWASASSTAQSTGALPVPSSWNYEFDKTHPTVAAEITWEANSSVTDRIMREIEEMQSQIPLTPMNSPATIGAATEESQTIESPPGLDVNQKCETG